MRCCLYALASSVDKNSLNMRGLLSDCTSAEQFEQPENNWSGNSQRNQYYSDSLSACKLMVSYGAHIVFSSKYWGFVRRTYVWNSALMLAQSPQPADLAFNTVEDPPAKPQHYEHEDDEDCHFYI